VAHTEVFSLAQSQNDTSTAARCLGAVETIPMLNCGIGSNSKGKKKVWVLRLRDNKNAIYPLALEVNGKRSATERDTSTSKSRHESKRD
jgi:hypothetical protein